MMRLANQVFLGWAQPLGNRPYHPLRGEHAGALPCPVPMFIPHEVLHGHTYISGGTQSGKSSAGMAGLLMQILAGTYTPFRGANGKPMIGLDGRTVEQRACNPLVLVLDLKGDLAQKNLIEGRCRELGIRFQFLACEPGAQSACFNPLPHLILVDADSLTLADTILAAHGMCFGAGYGRSFFFAMNRMLTLQIFQSGGPSPRCYRELVELLNRTFDPETHRAAMEIVATFQALAAYPILQPAQPGTDEIDLERLVATGGVVYVWAPMTSTAFIPRDVTRLLLFSFINTVRRHNLWNPAEQRRAYVFIDEAQVLAGMNIEVLFQQASSAGVGLVLANQSPSDLNSHENPRLWSTVETNTRLKIHFTVPTVDDRQRILRLSPETVGVLASDSWTTATTMSSRGGSIHESRTTTYHPQVHPSLNVNDLLWVNSTPGLAVVELSPDAGTTRLGGEPLMVYIPYAVSEAEYKRLKLIPLQRKVVPPHSTTARLASEVASTPVAIAANTYAQLEDLYKQLTGRKVRDP